MTQEPFAHTPSVAANMQPINYLLRGLGAAAQTIFRSLSVALSLEAGERFEDFHNPKHPSSDMLRLLKYHKTEVIDTQHAPQTPHTDLGSLTFVFSTTPGLQVLPHMFQRKEAPKESDWVFVAPRVNCAIVNFGDCMTMLTGGLIKSSLHRVGPLPGVAMHERYSFAYLMRPEEDTPLRPVKSPLVPESLPRSSLEETLTSGEWILRKFQALRWADRSASENEGIETGAKKRTDEILTGGRAVMV